MNCFSNAKSSSEADRPQYHIPDDIDIDDDNGDDVDAVDEHGHEAVRVAESAEIPLALPLVLPIVSNSLTHEPLTSTGRFCP